MKGTRLAGHGMPYEDRTLWDPQSPGHLSNGEGDTACECGEWSPVLPNTAARKRWHREHKAQQAPK